MSSQVIKVLRRNLIQALRNKQLREARSLLEQLKEEEPLSRETRGLELDYLIAAGQWVEAQTIADQLLRLFPQSARIHFLAGRVKYREKDYGTALRCFIESHTLYDHWQTRRWLGKTHTQQGQFTEAEAALVALLPEHAAINLDLAWLYERMEQPARALEHIERYLAANPGNEFAKAQRLRLRASMLEPEALYQDVDTLLDLDEEVPKGMLSAYVRNLLESGQGHQARQFISQYSEQIDEQTAVSLAWVCHKLQAYDLAMTLFLQGLPLRANDVKYLSALESAARHCNRIEALIAYYESRAPDERRFYGRIKALRKRKGAAP